MAWTTGLGPVFDLLLVGAFAGLVGTLAMAILEFPVYRARGVRGVPDYVLNSYVTKRVLGLNRGGRLPVAILSHFMDGALVGVAFLLARPLFGPTHFLIAGLLFGVSLCAISILLYRLLIGSWLWRPRESREPLLLHLSTHILYGLVVATLIHFCS